MTLILQGTDNSVSSPAVQGGTAGTTTGVYYPATNQLALATNGSLTLLADANQNIGVGGATPSAWSGYKGIQFPQGTSLVGNTSAPSMILAENLYSTNSGGSWTYSSTAPGVLGVFESNFFKVYTAPSGTSGTTATITNITTTNPYGIGLGNGTTPSSGVGITFPASQSSSSDANTLDDYEEGTWYPVLTAGTNTVTASTNYYGRYTKIGDGVWFTMYARFNTAGFTGSWGNTKISLPFANGNSASEQYGAISISYVSNFLKNVPSGYEVCGYVESGAANLLVTISNPNASETNISNTYLNLVSNAGIMIMGYYRTSNA